MKNHIKINKLFHFFVILITLFFITIVLSSCKKSITINDPIALGYISDKPYIINKDGNTLSLDEYSEVKPYYGEYLMVRNNKHWGYIKSDGSIILKCKYDEVYPMAENKAVVRIKQSYHIIDNLGNIIYTFTDGISSNSYFKEDFLVINKDNKFGFLKYENLSFTLLDDTLYDYANPFSEGFSAVGMLKDGSLKYTYLTKDLKLINNDFIYEKIDDFSCGYGMVGSYSVGNLKYLFLKAPTNDAEIQNPSFLLDKTTNRIVSYDYATRFKNNVTFVANYKVYQSGTLADNTRFYKEFTFIDTLGNREFDDAINSIAKPTPKNFFCFEPLYINDVFCFINAKRSVPICNLIRLTKFQQITIDDTYTTFQEFKEVTYDISDESEVLKKLMAENDWTMKLAKTYLTYPTEFKSPVFNEALNSYILATKIYGDKWGFVKITSKKIDEENRQKNNLDEYDIYLEYIIPLEFDYIIY